MTKHRYIFGEEKTTALMCNYSVNVTLQSHFEGIMEKELGNSLSNVNLEAKYLKIEKHPNQKEFRIL